MMAKQIKSGLMILVCSLLLAGCGLTIGPKVENRAIIVKAGTPIECLEQVTVRAHILKETGEAVNARIWEQDVGGWIMMHPDHWKSLKGELGRLRKKVGE